MIIICYQIKDFETYTRTQSPRSVGAIAINVQQISTITPMELWVDGKEKDRHITSVTMQNGTIFYLNHSLDEMDGMLRGITCVHDYRMQHGTHYLIPQEYEKPEYCHDFDDHI
tara:strand:+ start:7983 stop:8321 length:339 start_codon:yes stop_codon:yes gene_type:complete